MRPKYGVKDLFKMIIVLLIDVLPHAGYQNVSPGLGEHLGKLFL
jgi:hypothetical protein